MTEKKKEPLSDKKPLKQELEQMLEQSQTETLRVQDAYKTLLTREKDLCLEINQIKVDRDSAVKAKEAAEEALRNAKGNIERANRLRMEKLKEKDEEMILKLEVIDKAEKLNISYQKEREKLSTQIVKLEKDNVSLRKQIGKNTVLPVSKPRPLFRVFSICGALALVLCFALVGTILLDLSPTVRKFISKVEAPLTGVTFNRTSDNVDVIGSHNMPLTNIREPISNWASENGYDSVLFGAIRRWDGKEVLDTGVNHVSLSLIIKEMRKRGDKKAISFAKNPDGITLPSPFVKSSQGDMQFWQTRKKLAGIIPSFWSDKKQVNFKSKNFHGTIREGEATIKVGDMPVGEMYPIDEPAESH